jgi:hypothetical protein
MSTDPVRVGVLSLHNSKETKAICNAVEALGHEPVWLREENAAIRVDGGTVDIEPAVDVIANRLLVSNTDQPAELLGLATTFERIRPMLNDPDAVLASIHKFASAATLADWNVRVPDSRTIGSTRTVNGSARSGCTKLPSAPTAAAPGRSTSRSASTRRSATDRRFSSG